MLAVGHEPKPQDGRVGFWTRDEVVAMDNRALARLSHCHPEKAPPELRAVFSKPKELPAPPPLPEAPNAEVISRMIGVASEHYSSHVGHTTSARQVALFLLGEAIGFEAAAKAFSTLPESAKLARSKIAPLVAERALVIEPTRNCFDELFTTLVENEAPVRPTRKELTKLCASVFNVSVEDIISQRRTKRIVRPRQVAMFLCKRFTLSSFPEIGRSFGNRDHTTALHACARVESCARAFDIDGGDDPSAWATAFARVWGAP